MAKTKLYTLLDTEAGLTGPNMQHRREAPAIRDFHTVLGMKETNPGRYPEQFKLVCIGEMNDETGQLSAYTPPETITTGAEWLATNERNALISAATALNGESVQRSAALSMER